MDAVSCAVCGAKPDTGRCFHDVSWPDVWPDQYVGGGLRWVCGPCLKARMLGQPLPNNRRAENASAVPSVGNL